MQRRYEISDEQWERIKEMFPRAKTGRPGKDSRLIFNAILWIVCSGAPWRDLPERFGSWKTVYSRFCKWRDEGTLFRVFEDLKKDSDYENLSIDSTTVKAHQSKRFRSRTAYREKFRWKDNQNTCGCRWTWQSSVYRFDCGSGS